MLGQALRPVLRRVPKGSRSYIVENQPVTMNDLPVPQGCWQEHHNKVQGRYNMQMGIAVAAFVGTLGFIFGTHQWNFNYRPPKPNQ